MATRDLVQCADFGAAGVAGGAPLASVEVESKPHDPVLACEVFCEAVKEKYIELKGEDAWEVRGPGSLWRLSR